MVKVNVGDVIDISNARFGQRSNGSVWGFCNVKAESGYDKIVVWFQNAEEAQGRKAVEVVAIAGCKIANRKYTDKKTGQEKWGTDYSCEISVRAAGAQEVRSQETPPNFGAFMGDFMDLDNTEWTELPFA